MKKNFKVLNILIVTILLINSITCLTFATSLQDEDYFKDFTGLYLVDDEIYINSKETNKVKVEVYGEDSIKDISVNFFNSESGESFNAKLEGKVGTSDTYLIIPNNVKTEIRYEMMYVNVTSSNGTITTYATTNGLPGFMNTFGRKYLTIKKIENKDIKLKSLQFAKSEIDLDKETTLPVTKLEFEGDANYDLVSVCFKNDYGNTFGPGAIYLPSSGIIDLNVDGQYPKIVRGTTYYLTDIFVMSDGGATLLKHYVTPKGSIAADQSDTELFNINYSLKILDNTNKEETNKSTIVLEEVDDDNLRLNKIGFKNGTTNFNAKLNEKIEMDLDYVSNEKVKSIMLSFYSDSLQSMMPVYLKSFDGQHPYFIVPSDVKAGTYEMNYVLFEMENGKTYHYRKGNATSDIKHYDFNSYIKISSETTTNEENRIEFINDKNIDIAKSLEEITENTVISIDANNNTIIKKEIFEAIKDKNVTLRIICSNIEWVINGKDIETVKDIDVHVYISEFGKEEKSAFEGISKGYIINFSSNGYLPGKTLIRVKLNSLSSEDMASKKYNAYYYNETDKIFDRVAINKIVSDDGYFEFYINHNSSFVLSEEEADSKYISDKTDDLELNLEENIEEDIVSEEENVVNDEKTENYFENNKLLIVVIILIIIIIIMGIVIINNKKNKK